MSRRSQHDPEWRSIPPFEFCYACGQGDATRAIIARGDRDWLMATLALAIDSGGEEVAQVVDGAWERLYQIPYFAGGYRSMSIRLCRRCANQAQQRFVDSGAPAPVIYNATKLRSGHYENASGIDQPEMNAVLERAIEELTNDPEFQARFTEQGLTLCRRWNEDKQDWAVYVTANPELIAEDAVDPRLRKPPEGTA